MSTKIITVSATPPAESSGVDYNKGAPLNATEFDQNIVNLRAAVDRKCPMGGPGSSQAFSVGGLLATGAVIGNSRPVSILGGGSLSMKNNANDGAWSNSYSFNTATTDTSMVAFGAFGSTKDSADYAFIGPSYNNTFAQFSMTGIGPGADNARSNGAVFARWSTVYAGSGTINTSDAREKTAVLPLTENEIAAAKQLSAEIGTYQFLSAVAEKGDKARRHVGMTVQRAIEIMQSHGLDPFAYGFICYDKWDDMFINHPAVVATPAIPAQPAEYETRLANETIIIDGKEQTAQKNVMICTKEAVAAIEAVESKEAWREQTRVAGDRYSFRPDELLLFIARGIDARLTALEAK